MTNELSTTLEAGPPPRRPPHRHRHRTITTHRAPRRHRIRLHTNTIHRTWSITDLDTGTAETNQNGLYTHVNRAGQPVHEAKSPTTGLVPPAIRLCYPLDLPIWGRQHDNFTIARAESTPTGYLIHLAHTHDSTQHGTLTIDAETGLLTLWIIHRDNNLIADYELTSIVRPRHRPTSSNDDGTITSISFDDKTNDA